MQIPRLALTVSGSRDSSTIMQSGIGREADPVPGLQRSLKSSRYLFFLSHSNQARENKTSFANNADV